MRRWVWILLLTLVCAAGCASSGGKFTEAASVEQTGKSLAAPDTTMATEIGDLRISPLDTLEISVFGVNQLNGAYQIDPEGKLKLPLVGIVDAKGYTTFELAKVLEGKLSERFLQDPQVTVRLSGGSRRNLTVEGAVTRPGLYPVTGNLTLMQAVAQSGGPTDRADVRKVLIFRTIDGERRAARFNLEDIRRGEAEDPPVYGNDIVVVFGSRTQRNYLEVMRLLPLVGMFVGLR
jgi:polysaccharide biosynthesis/export protein